jgi:hypothetical protein
MSKPARKCEFCPRTDLTKSHIWPDWAQNVIPAIATHYEIKTGETSTYKARASGPIPSIKVKPGAVAKRRPRNTCTKCNGGWMREIEETAKLKVSALMLGYPFLLGTLDQRHLAAFLCLVSMRIALGNKIARPIPSEDHEYLIANRVPPPSGWRIWIMKYADDRADDYWYGYLPMAMMSPTASEISGPLNPLSVRAEHCNMQVTTLVVGKLCAHIFSTTIEYDISHYQGLHMTQIWPPTRFDIDTGFLPAITAETLPWLHEAIASDRDVPEDLIT